MSDQAFTPITAGCFICPPTFVNGKVTRPKLVVKNGFWRCSKCGGYYGEADADR